MNLNECAYIIKHNGSKAPDPVAGTTPTPKELAAASISKMACGEDIKTITAAVATYIYLAGNKDLTDSRRKSKDEGKPKTKGETEVNASKAKDKSKEPSPANGTTKNHEFDQLKVNDFAHKIGLNGSSELGKRLKLFMLSFDVKDFFLVDVKPGTASIKLGPKVNAAVIRRCEWLLNGYLALVRQRAIRPRIRIGCGLALVPDFIPNVIARYRRAQQCADPSVEFDVEIRSELPQELRKHAQQGQYDLVITSFEDNYHPKSGDKYYSRDLRMILLVERNNKHFAHLHKSNPDKDVLDSKDFTTYLKDIVVAVPDPVRLPDLRFPASLLPDTATTVHVEKWFEALAMTLCGDGTVSAAYPHFFPDDERARFREYGLEGAEFPKLHLGVLMPQIILDPEKITSHDASHKRIVEGLYDLFAEVINELGAQQHSNKPKLLPFHMRHTAHVTQVRDGTYEWSFGELRHLRITPSGFMRAQHHFEAESEPQEFAIEGRISHVTDGGHNGVVHGVAHYVWTGINHGDESYVVSMSADSKDRDKLIVGTWHGQRTWVNRKLPDSGYFVIYDPAQEGIAGSNDAQPHEKENGQEQAKGMEAIARFLEEQIIDKFDRKLLGAHRLPLPLTDAAGMLLSQPKTNGSS